MPMPDVYGCLHAYMFRQGIECVTESRRADRESEAEDSIAAAMNF